ncbi:TetR family transcriptional regulator [Pseudomonas chlororaphis subsp. aurantiaca]|uniref:TetR/AcrR family transcriptional regulator n=1 Tax=Pseudomonas chlororaphis TaxID=587753 RepID=UPI00050D857E|nr:TetR/AcrR family transcriptional regulator [Pseudomonas chlororaphis]AIS12969.1 TetR family transcriptional regulator [Pseudomonas chlororaphis subsp. aurantiaca]
MHDSPLSPKSSGRQADGSKAKPAARRGRPVGNHDEKRTELLTAAIAVIAQDGYAGASMRKVAQQAGCTTGAVTYYFANKEEMVTAVAQSLFDQIDTLLERQQEPIDIKSLIEQWLNWMSVDEPNGWLAWFQLLAHARHEPAFAVVIKQRYARFRQVLTSMLETGQKQGKIRDDIAADLLADQISALSDGWMMMLPIEPERFTPARSQALFDAVITLISPPAPKSAEALR